LQHVLSSTAKRSFALIGAAAVGIIAALGAGAPAFACHSIITGTPECADGSKVKITWTVTNSETDRDAKVVSVTPAVNGFKIGDQLPGSAKKVNLVGTTLVDFTPGGSATLKVKLKWQKQNHHTPEYEGTGTASFADLTCGSPSTPPDNRKPTVKFTPSCDGTLSVVIHNPFEKPLATETKAGAWTKPVTVPAGSDAPAFSVPAENAANVMVFTVSSDGNKADKPIGSSTGASAQGCAVPDVSAKASCDGQSVVINNPLEGRPIEAVVTVGTDQTKVKVAAGTSEIVKIGKLDALTATVKIAGGDETVISFDKLTNCVQPVSANEGPTLPVTGTNVALIAGGSAALIGLGGALFWLSRRRKVQFTA
jgi:LPXTG-motif cell wall-anchored protein